MVYDKTTDLLDIQADVLTTDTSANTAPQGMFTGGQYSGTLALTYFSPSSTDGVGFRFARHVCVE